MRTSKPAKKRSGAKIFVLDTNIILHDHNAIRQFKDNDIVIPVAVIEELDKFKKGNDSLSFNARAFMRDISAIIDGHKLGPNGISLGPRMGRIKVEPNHPFAPEMQDFFRDTADLKENAARLHDCYPVIHGTFTGTHTGLSRFGCHRLVREDLDPYFTATADITRHSDTGCLDLI